MRKGGAGQAGLEGRALSSNTHLRRPSTKLCAEAQKSFLVGKNFEVLGGCRSCTDGAFRSPLMSRLLTLLASFFVLSITTAVVCEWPFLRFSEF